MANYRVISSDNHVMEPGDLWTARVESKYKGREPHIVRREDGSDWWVCDEHLLIGAFAGTQTGLRFDEPEKLSVFDTVENIRPGGYIPEEHLKDMDIDGVDVSVLFPTVGLVLYGVPDSGLLTSLFRTYNDWVADFCSQSPKRLKGIAMVNVDDIGDGIEELERCAKMGMAGAMITVYPETMSYDYPEYEPLWAAAQDLEMPLNMHIGTNRPHPGQEFADFESASRTFFTNVDHWIRMSLGYLIFTGVFERYPKLQVGSWRWNCPGPLISLTAWTTPTPRDPSGTGRRETVGPIFKMKCCPAISSTGTCSWVSRKTLWGYSFGTLLGWITSCGDPTTRIRSLHSQGVTRSSKKSWLDAPKKRRRRSLAAMLPASTI